MTRALMSASLTLNGIRTFAPGSTWPTGSTTMSLRLTPARIWRKNFRTRNWSSRLDDSTPESRSAPPVEPASCVSAAVLTCVSFPRPTAKVRSSMEEATSAIDCGRFWIPSVNTTIALSV